MAPTATNTRPLLQRLVAGLTGLRHDGRFHESNLDGTAGDYISFDSWKWPQGAGLYRLMRLYQHERDPAVLKTVEDWYQRNIAASLSKMNINTTAPLLALSILMGSGTAPYAFVWGMTGENQAYNDVSPVPVETLR